MPIRRFAALAVTALAATPLAVAQAPLPPRRSIEDLLPASSYAALRFGGLSACRSATDQLSMAAMIGPFVARLPAELRAEQLERWLDRAADALRDGLQHAGVRPADLRAVAGQPMALGVGRLTVEGMGPSVALLIEVGEHEGALHRVFDAAVQQLSQMAAPVDVSATEIAGVAVRVVRGANGPPLYAGTVGDAFVLTNSRGYLQDLAAVAAGRQPGLAAATRLGALRRELPAPALAAWLLQTHSACASLAPHLPYEAGDYADALGLGQVDVVYGALTAGQGDGTDLLHVGVGGSEHGLAKALVAAPVDLSFAGACSPNTVLFAAGSLDVPAVLDAFRRFEQLLPAGAKDELQRDLGRSVGRELRRLGTNAEEVEGLLRAFGHQVGVAIGLEKGAVPKPELLLRVAVADAAPVVALLQRLEATAAREAGIEWKRRDVDGCEVRFCSVPIEDTLQLSPCYALRDGALWLGSDVAALVRALRQQPGDSLAAEDDFAALQRQAVGASGVVHLRAFRGVEIGWRQIETLVYPMVDAQADRLGFDSEALPDAETLANALGTTTWLWRVDDDGITLKTRGTLTFGALLAAAGALADQVLSRTTSRLY